MNGLTNKSILIVGGGSGIGLATALRAAASGATPIIAGRSREKLDAALAKLPNSARAEVLDFADAASVTSLAERIGPIDHLVLSASRQSPGADSQTSKRRRSAPRSKTNSGATGA